MAYAIIKTGGRQFKVAAGETLTIDKLDLNPGDIATFSDVLMIGDGDSFKIGAPLLEGAKVEAEVIDQVKGDKVIAFKYKRRKGYHRTVGHRQKLTKVKITGITA